MLSTLLFATCPSLSAAICALGFSAFLLILLPSYQDRRAPGTVYFAFIMLGVMSVYFIQVLCYLPFLWLAMRSKLMNLGYRSFFASLLGILTPYWFILGYLPLRAISWNCHPISSGQSLSAHFSNTHHFPHGNWLPWE